MKLVEELKISTNMRYGLNLLFLVSFGAFAQSNVSIDQRILDAELKKLRLIKSIVSLQDSITRQDQMISNLKLESAMNGNSYMIGVLKESTIVRDDYEGNTIDRLSKGDTVKIYKWKYWDLLVEYRLGKMGYIGQVYLEKNDLLANFLQSLESKARDERTKEIYQEEELRKLKQRQELQSAKDKVNATRVASIKSKFSKYGSKVVSDLIDEKIWIGMTSDMAIASWGDPERVNKTVSSNGAKEQWVYAHDYLYFRAGILETFQTSR